MDVAEFEPRLISSKQVWRTNYARQRPSTTEDSLFPIDLGSCWLSTKPTVKTWSLRRIASLLCRRITYETMTTFWFGRHQKSQLAVEITCRPRMLG